MTTAIQTSRSLIRVRGAAVAAKAQCQRSFLTNDCYPSEKQSGMRRGRDKRQNITSILQSTNDSHRRSISTSSNSIVSSCLVVPTESAFFTTNLRLTRNFATVAVSTPSSSVVSSESSEQQSHHPQEEEETNTVTGKELPSTTTTVPADMHDSINSTQLSFAGIPPLPALERALRPHIDEEWDSSVATSMEVKKQNLHKNDKGGLISGTFLDTTTMDPHFEDVVGGTAVEHEALLLEQDSSETIELRYAPRKALPWDELRHHVETTRQLLQMTQAWSTEDWFQAEVQFRNVWTTQHSVRAVVLQFALFHRALLEREALRNRGNNHSSGGGDEDTVHHHRSDNWVGLPLLNRMLSNWKVVYIGGNAQELCSSNCHLSPPELLETIVAFYHDRFRLSPSEWTMFLLLDADVNVWRPETPQFSQEILDTTIELYQTGEVRCKPKAQLFNCILNSWIPASQQRGHNGTAAVAAVKEVFDCMKEHDVLPNGRTYKYALRLWSEQGTRDAALAAENLLQRMYADFLAGVEATKPDLHAFNLVVVAWARSGILDAGPRCEEIYRQMELLREKDHVFGGDDISLINNTILAYAQSKTVQGLQQGEQFWRTTGIPGDHITYSLLIKEYAHFGRIEDVERLIREKTSQGNGGTNDLSTYVLVFKAYAESKLADKAVYANELLQYLEQDVNNRLNTIVYNGTWCMWI